VKRFVLGLVLALVALLLLPVGSASANPNYTCSSGWTDMFPSSTDPNFGGCEKTLPNQATYEAALGMLPVVHSAMFTDDVGVIVVAADGTLLFHAIGGYSGDGAVPSSGSAGHADCVAAGPCPTSPCPCHALVDDFGQDYGAGGPGLLPDPAVQGQLDGLLSSGPFYSIATAPGGNGGAVTGSGLSLDPGLGGGAPAGDTLTGDALLDKIVFGTMTLMLTVALFELAVSWTRRGSLGPVDNFAGGS
jgi:hypothetical protein